MTKRGPWNKGKKFSREYRMHLAEARGEFLKEHGKEYSEKMRKEMKRVFLRHPEYAEKMRKVMERYYRDESPGEKLKREEKMRRAMTIVSRDMIDRKMTEFWRNHPGLRKERSERLKRYFLGHPKALENLMGYSKKPIRRHIRTRQGFIVRSKGEKKIADFLFAHGIKSEYEGRVLKFPEMVCVPDFYLPKYRRYIEFYGGYPGSRNRKVEKNRLYKKYHVRCMFITPSELRDLGKTFKHEGIEV